MTYSSLFFFFLKGGKSFPEKSELSDTWVQCYFVVDNRENSRFFLKKSLRQGNKRNHQQVMGSQQIPMDY